MSERKNIKNSFLLSCLPVVQLGRRAFDFLIYIARGPKLLRSELCCQNIFVTSHKGQNILKNTSENANVW